MMVEDAMTMVKAWELIKDHDKKALDNAVRKEYDEDYDDYRLCRCTKCTALMEMLSENGFFDAKVFTYDNGD